MQEIEEIMHHINPPEFFGIVEESSGEDCHSAIVHKDLKKNVQH